MTQDSKRVRVGEDREDRISGLPSNVIDCFLALLPVHDAARTSILSKRWRYVWAMLPNLVLDKLFCKKLLEKSQYALERTVDKILLRHLGDIVKFALDVSDVQLSSDTDIDTWMLYVIRHGVQELVLNMPKNNNAYKLPSYVFTCPTLTCLKLFHCVFKPPNSSLDFPNLITLHMERITVDPTTELCVIKAPLVSLTLMYCDGTQNLNIVSSQLKSLVVCQSHYDLELNCFTNCKNLTKLHFVVVNPKRDLERSVLDDVFINQPALEELMLGTFVLELLSAGAIPKGLVFMLNCLWHLMLGVNFNRIGDTVYALELIKISPNLSKLEIWVNALGDSDEAAMKFLDSLVCLDRPFNKLKDVVMHSFKGSKTALLFVKLLFASSPSLLRMTIKQENAVGSSEERNNITTELMRFPRASPKAELFYLANAH